MPASEFRVELDIYRGPLDLLLYLVRKHEVEITDIPIAPITEQFLEYLSLLQHLNMELAGEFLEIASTLVEIKSRMVLPRAEEQEEPLEDPRQELVQRLLEYKQFKDAASMLEDRARHWQQRYPRLAGDLPLRARDPAEEPIHEVELWDLVSAFGRILREQAAAQPSSIRYDDTPIHVYMGRIHERLIDCGRLAFTDLLTADMHRSSLIGMFLAVLELVRHHGVVVEQDDSFGEIWLLRPPDAPAQVVEFAPVADYDSPADPPAEPAAASPALAATSTDPAPSQPPRSRKRSSRLQPPASSLPQPPRRSRRPPSDSSPPPPPTNQPS